MVDGGREPMVLLHGWGMGPRVFADWRQRFESSHDVYCPALPGCGRAGSPAFGADSIDAAADQLVSATARPAHWIGWSLGGLIALAVARRTPAAVNRVTLVASSPRMAAGPDWPGIEPAALNAFRGDLRADPATAHDRFLTLQVRGSVGPRTALRGLRRAVAADGLPTLEVLLAGLHQLADSDLRTDLDALSCPVDAVLGERDQLIPMAVAPRLEALAVPTRIIPGAGHAPFVSHPDTVADAIVE